MTYATAVGIYISVYVLSFVLPLMFGSGGSVIRLLIFSIPILLVVPRVAQRFSGGETLLPDLFRGKGGPLYVVGIGLIWLGHLIFFGTIGLWFYLAATGAAGVPVGIFTAYSMYPYLLGIVLVEISYRQWSSRQAEQPWRYRKKPVFIAVGIISAAHLGLNLTDDRPVELLGYYEREALALGRGYAREVQRAATRFYAAEERIPCAEDGFVDVGSLVHSANRDMREYLSIELLECGQFVVTIHKPVDGVTDGQLLYVASPGDADAGRPLEWQCQSAHHERIERHTNGDCSYNSTLAAILPAPTETPAIASTATRSANLAPASRPPEPPAATRPASARPVSAPSIQQYLDRLSEPTLWEDCGSETTSYRFMRFDADQYVAAVRISHDSKAGAYRSVTSTTPESSIGMDGFVDDRTWGRLETGFSAADFWNLSSTQSASKTSVYLEACKDGTYHAVQRDLDDSGVASIASIFTSVGRLDWLEN